MPAGPTEEVSDSTRDFLFATLFSCCRWSPPQLLAGSLLIRHRLSFYSGFPLAIVCSHWNIQVIWLLVFSLCGPVIKYVLIGTKGSEKNRTAVPHRTQIYCSLLVFIPSVQKIILWLIISVFQIIFSTRRLWIFFFFSIGKIMLHLLLLPNQISPSALNNST